MTTATAALRISAPAVAAVAIKPAAASVDQPAVPRDAKLLMAAYDYDGLKLDLWGYPDDAGGCEVHGVTVHGVYVAKGSLPVDISSLLSLAQLTKIGWDVDRHLVDVRQEEAQNARIEYCQWERAMEA